MEKISHEPQVLALMLRVCNGISDCIKLWIVFDVLKFFEHYVVAEDWQQREKVKFI